MQRPERMSLANLTTAQAIDLQYNPTELAMDLEVDWASGTILGLSHELLQYSHTKNLQPSFELAFDEVANRQYDAQKAMRFLMSLCYAPKGASDIRAGAPPRVLFVWPNLCTLTTVIAKESFKFTRFAQNGRPTGWIVQMTIKEIRDVRLTMEDVLLNGIQRPAAALTEDS